MECTVEQFNNQSRMGKYLQFILTEWKALIIYITKIESIYIIHDQ